MGEDAGVGDQRSRRARGGDAQRLQNRPARGQRHRTTKQAKPQQRPDEWQNIAKQNLLVYGQGELRLYKDFVMLRKSIPLFGCAYS